MADRRFPPPVVVAELEACFIDQSGIGTCSLFGATGAGAVGVGRGRGSGGGATCGIGSGGTGLCCRACARTGAATSSKKDRAHLAALNSFACKTVLLWRRRNDSRNNGRA